MLNTHPKTSCSPASGRPGEMNVGENERVISLLGGGVILFALARYGSLLGVVGAVAGAGLLARGLSGHCDLYQALGINSSETHLAGQRAKADFEHTESMLDEASEDSFPASDPPAWTGTTA